jgi:amidophosphoribosyltransferase
MCLLWMVRDPCIYEDTCSFAVDSIVRGTTSKEIVQMAKDVGAKKVIVASCAPPIRYPNVYGIDMPSRRELVAYGRGDDEIASSIGADLVIFQSLSDLEDSVRQLNPNICKFDCSVFTGEYVTGGIDEQYFQHIEDLRSDNNRLKLGKALLESSVPNSVPESPVSVTSGGLDSTVGLHNTWKTN